MGATVEQKILIEQRVTNEGPSVVAAYLLWFFLGFVSAHRFYLGRIGSAICQLVLNLLLIGLVWLVIDLFLIPRMVRAKQAELRRRFGLLVAPTTSAILTGTAPAIRF
ncbi:TM2 domain-containing protein [Methylobacterium komagatae]|uniref:TM2 domain-containing protein n=1 Tax=Methylobacterium komagatae TaxID=374425 RepID=A0ABW2BHF2_9HYPH